MKVLRCCAGLLTLVLSLFVGCGGGESGKIFSFPQSAIEVKAIYDSSPEILENPLAPGATRNPDVVITITGDINSYKVVINYQGVEIYNQVNGWGTYLLNGFTEQGNYLLLIREYPAGSYTGTSKIFIDGKLLNLQLDGPVNNIKEFDGWLILLSQVGNIRSGLIKTSWSMYNPATGELKEFGISGQLNG